MILNKTFRSSIKTNFELLNFRTVAKFVNEIIIAKVSLVRIHVKMLGNVIYIFFYI